MQSKKFRPLDVGSIGNASIEPCERRVLMSTYTVNTLSDAMLPVTGQLTLRQAVLDANLHPGNDTVNFDPKLLAAGKQYSIVLINGPLSFYDATGTTTLIGPGSALLAINGNMANRVVDVSTTGTAVISGLTVTGGVVSTPVGTDALGGGILNNGSLTLDNTSVSGNQALGGLTVASAESSAETTAGAAMGGGIYSDGPLTLVNSVITGNSANGESYNHSTGAAGGGNAAGGAIYSTAAISINGSVVNGNIATGGSAKGDGGVPGVNDLSLRTGDADGGGIYSTASLSVSNTNISNNEAMPGYFTGTRFGYGGNAAGGGIYASDLTILTRDSLTGNTSEGGHGGFISGSGGNSSGGAIFASANLFVSDSTFDGNQSIAGKVSYPGTQGNAVGGAIMSKANLNVVTSTISGNMAIGGGTSSGGGIYSADSLQLMASTISGNTVAGGAGLLFLQGGSASGGGISTNGQSEIVSSTISGNQALGAPGDYDAFYGGGLQRPGNGGSAFGGGVGNSGSLTISFSTLSENEAIGGAGGFISGQFDLGFAPAGLGGSGDGGGVAGGTLVLGTDTIVMNSAVGGAGGDIISSGVGGNGGDAEGGGVESAIRSMSDCTIVSNKAVAGLGSVGRPEKSIDPVSNGSNGAVYGGGIYLLGTTATKLDNSIVSGDLAGVAASDISGTVSSSSAYNLIGVGGGLTNGVNGNKVGINNPLLEPLGNYGGPTETMVPLPGSPAVNAGSNSLIPAGVTTDQRGYARIFGSLVDIGADELNNALISGVVYNDANGDGIQESAEGGLGGQVVYDDLTNSGYYQSADPSTTTNSSGQYTLNGLPEGTTIIRVKIPSADRQSYPAGTSAHAVTIGPAAVTGQNFGLSTKLYISGKITFNGVGQGNMLVYADLNNDGKFESNENNKLTGSDGTFAFVSLIAGTYTFRVAPLAGEIQTSPANNAGITVTLGSGGVDSNVNFTFASATISKFAGTAIGTPGSYRNHGTTIADAFDQNFNTFFDAPDASGDWVGLDLGSAKIVTQVKFAPRAGYEYRMDGGEIQASNSANFSSGVVTLYTISSTPAAGVLTAEHLSNTTAYRYYRYLGPANSYCDIAELEFDG